MADSDIKCDFFFSTIVFVTGSDSNLLRIMILIALIAE